MRPEQATRRPTTAVASTGRSLRATAAASGDADRARRLALAGGALLALSLASLGLLVVAGSVRRGRLSGR
ncbi:MAG: hypothetical protein QOF04_2118 [Solirubrobacteraceae bacterium]|jgi:hypothetical protein|nr:hypothetical protein [Solirubrobacteraceae bacterium]